MSSAFRPVWLMLAVLCAIAGYQVWRHAFPAHELIPWRSDFTAASAEASAAGKPMIVDFWATWCGPCRNLNRTTWSDPDVARALKDYIPVKVNVDQHPDLAGKYGVPSTGIPLVLVLDPSGRAIAHRAGAYPGDPGDFLSWLQESSPQRQSP
jgi:thioredoxin-like negative regulator of GroEL